MPARASWNAGATAAAIVGVGVAIVACGSTSPTPTSPAQPASQQQPQPIENVADVRVAPHELAASLERTGCLGWCASYIVEIYRDGVVEYHGRNYVKHIGDAKGRITKSQLAELDRAFADGRYFSLADSYTHHDVTDAPSATVTYRVGGREKRLPHYYGDLHTPKIVPELEDKIDRIVNIDRWIGTADEREAHAHEWRGD